MLLKGIALCLIVAQSTVLASYQVFLYPHGDGTPGCYSISTKSKRKCVCVKNFKTAVVENDSGGVVRMFSTSDCTGNYATLGYKQDQINAYWVNSVSFGPSGTSVGPSGCPSRFGSC
ncbi:hypothetical protein BC940DRAFT_314338 [Gongronella butleri]|nr:hypothetical protein BC940DRAFT_314338 [Gongronella butleri]